MLFGTPDRVPLTTGGGRKSTKERWYSEGLPQDVSNISLYAYQQVGGKLPWPGGGPSVRVNERMIPQFEEKVIEEKVDSLVVQDWKGNVCEISNQYSVEYLRNAIDFVTRRWLKCPVESRADWADMKRRYDAATPQRVSANATELSGTLVDRNYPVEVHFSGPFWQLREWLGFEQLCMLFYDDTMLLQDMLDFWQEYVVQLMERVFEHMIPDGVHISEDMAYKCFSMVSPSMARKYLLPVWTRWGDVIRKHNIPVYACDSDGFIGELIPIWIEAGINCCDPIEVAAGNDIVAFREEFGKDISYRGGVDKRAMAKGGDVLAAEMERLRPIVEDGGYTPSCDHGIPADVSWPNFLDYVQRLAGLTGWL